MSKIIITGATGGFGGAAVQHLLALKVPASQIAVVARSPQKAQAFAEQGIEVRYGDYDQPASLTTAFADASRLLFVSSPDMDNVVRARQHAAVIEAARNAKVGQIVYTGLANPENMNMGLEKLHLASEYMLRLTGIPCTILRNTFYLEILANPGLKGSLASGELISATQGGRVNFALRSDMARAAAVVLTTPGHENKIYTLTNPQAYSYDEIAALLSRISGQPVRHLDLPAPEAAARLQAAGMPEGMAAFMVYAVYAAIAAGQFAPVTDDLVNLIGKENLTGYEQALRAALA